MNFNLLLKEKREADFCFFSDSKKLKSVRIGVDIRLPQVDCLEEDYLKRNSGTLTYSESTSGL